MRGWKKILSLLLAGTFLLTGSAGNTAVYANDQTQVMEAKDNSYANSVSDSSADSSSTSESVNTQQTETVS